MDTSTQDLLKILQIGHDTSMRGEGISLREAKQRTQYKKHRQNFGPDDLLPLIQANLSFCEEWLLYSEDKRTDGGWYLLRSAEIGNLRDRENLTRFGTMEEAVAEYVVREMDFWATIS